MPKFSLVTFFLILITVIFACNEESNISGNDPANAYASLWGTWNTSANFNGQHSHYSFDLYYDSTFILKLSSDSTDTTLFEAVGTFKVKSSNLIEFTWYTYDYTQYTNTRFCLYNYLVTENQATFSYSSQSKLFDTTAFPNDTLTFIKRL